MRSILGAGLLAVLLGGGVACAAEEDADIRKLIEQLGDDDLARRREASKRLEEIGTPALELLRKAEDGHRDPDVKLRAGLLVRAIENKGWDEVRVIVGPTRGYWFNRIAFTPDGEQAVIAGGAVIVYDLQTGKEIKRVLEVRGARPGLALSKDGRLCLTGHANDPVMRLIELPSGKEVQSFREGHGTGVRSVALSSDGARAASCGGKGTLHVWEVKSGKELYRRDDHPGKPNCVAFSADGKYLVTGHDGGTRGSWVRLWSADGGKVVHQCRDHTATVTAVAFAPDGRSFLSASLDGTVRQWKTESGNELRRLDHEGGVYDLAVSADGRRLLTAGFGDKTVRVWNLADGKELHRFTGHTTRVLGVAFSRDGRQALSSDADCTVRLWRLPL
ncbi:MAG TPA: WD40 repeat domain-containing protein [Gemmataceae bacterium]|jgi:WD40 repeat protein